MIKDLYIAPLRIKIQITAVLLRKIFGWYFLTSLILAIILFRRVHLERNLKESISSTSIQQIVTLSNPTPEIHFQVTPTPISKPIIRHSQPLSTPAHIHLKITHDKFERALEDVNGAIRDADDARDEADEKILKSKLAIDRMGPIYQSQSWSENEKNALREAVHAAEAESTATHEALLAARTKISTIVKLKIIINGLSETLVIEKTHAQSLARNSLQNETKLKSMARKHKIELFERISANKMSNIEQQNTLSIDTQPVLSESPIIASISPKEKPSTSPQPLVPQTATSTSSDIQIIILIATLITSFVAFLGFISTTIIVWRKEHRDKEHAEIDLDKKKLEIEKLTHELQKSE